MNYDTTFPEQMVQDSLDLLHEHSYVLGTKKSLLSKELDIIAQKYGFNFLGAGMYRASWEKDGVNYKYAYGEHPSSANNNKEQALLIDRIRNTRFEQFFQTYYEVSFHGRLLVCEFIKGKLLKNFEYDTRNSIKEQVLLIIRQLELELNISIYDLHNGNIIVTENGEFKIIDFRL